MPIEINNQKTHKTKVKVNMLRNIYIYMPHSKMKLLRFDKNVYNFNK